MAFWRRSKGRHALGAAVTAIPSRPVGVPQPFAPVPAAVPPAPAPVPALRMTDPPAPSYAPVVPLEPLDWSFPELQPPAMTGPRVELTFRDGTSASLDGTQARALDEIAQVLTRRD